MASRLMGAVAGWEKANTAGDGERREYLSVQKEKTVLSGRGEAVVVSTRQTYRDPIGL